MKIIKKIIGILSATAVAASCIVAAGVTASAEDTATTWDFTNQGEFVSKSTRENGSTGTAATASWVTITAGTAVTNDDVTTGDITDEAKSPSDDQISISMSANDQTTKLTSDALYIGRSDCMMYIKQSQAGTLTVDYDFSGIDSGKEDAYFTLYKNNKNDDTTSQTSTACKSAGTATFTLEANTLYTMKNTKNVGGKLWYKITKITFTPISSTTSATVSGEQLTKVTADDGTTADVWYYTVTPNDQTVSGVSVMVNDVTKTLESTKFSGDSDLCFAVVVGYAKDSTESYEPSVTLTVE